MYEAKGGSNLRNYRLSIQADRVTLQLPLLESGPNGLIETEASIPVAPSGQFSQLKANAKDETKIERFFSARQEFSAQLGGAEILFDRRHLEAREDLALINGDVGRVWLKLSLDIATKAPEGWLDGRGKVRLPAVAQHFRTSLAKASKHRNELAPGLRILSVDLGLRSLAACSVFELVKGRPDKGMAFLADADLELWARHERSFVLKLAGEDETVEMKRARRRVMQELGELRRDSRRLKDLLRLLPLETREERQQAVDDLVAANSSTSPAGVPTESSTDLATLRDALGSDHQSWQAIVKDAHRIAENNLAVRVGRWRRETRARPGSSDEHKTRRDYVGGKSTWSIDYLEKLRRFLLGWSLRGRDYSQVNRANREARGVFASRLLLHINKLKEDRLKAGADLLVQAARGYLPAIGKGWREAFSPCRVILFEDLARYRFQTDRPRRENSTLMRWCHRELVRAAEMQAELYGIGIDSVGPGFTSRFHARSGAPGVRLRSVTSDDLQSPFLVEQLKEVADRIGLPLRPGIVLPWDGGELFGTVNADGLSLTIHADINAAQNLQRRFWTRHHDVYRLTAVEVTSQDGQSAHYPVPLGARLLGGIKATYGDNGYIRLMPAVDGDGFVPSVISSREWQRATNSSAVLDEETRDNSELVELDESEMPEVSRGTRATFFRDPSGLVVRSDRWYFAKDFWGMVSQRIGRALQRQADPF